VYKLGLLGHLRLHFLGDVPAQRAVTFVPDDGVATRRHQNTEEAINDTVGGQLVLESPISWLIETEAERRANIEGEKVFVDGLEVGKDLLDLIDDVADIVLGEKLDFVIVHRIREVWWKAHSFRDNNWGGTYRDCRRKRWGSGASGKSWPRSRRCT